MKTSIELISGRRINAANPDLNYISIMDISTALSRMPRFGGHTLQPWSVAQHSLLVSYLVPGRRLSALLHDAPEGLGLMDVPTPLKRLMPDYARVYAAMEKAVEKRFGLNYGALHCAEVRRADALAYEIEYRELMWNGRDHHDGTPLLDRWISLSPKEAAAAFESRYLEVQYGR